MSLDALKNAATDPDAGSVSHSCFDLLLIELVPMAYRLAEELYITDYDPKGDASKAPKPDDEEIKEAVFYRLESLGYRVGLGLAESLTATLPLLSRADSLDTIKFLCKELWIAVFRKQIDNLKTNHRGTFVLTDNRFEPLRRCSLAPGRMEEAKVRATPFLHFPTGLLRGALAALGLEAEVKAEVVGSGLPGASFQIKMKGAT